MLYMLCDGHLGREAADFVCMHLMGLIAPHVPPADPDAMSPKGVESVDTYQPHLGVQEGSVGCQLASVAWLAWQICFIDHEKAQQTQLQHVESLW